ncbi:MAG: FRG domain-containing protein [Bryobacteraceae bacterium]|jgi:hypothetical protein
MEVIVGKIVEMRAASAGEFWEKLSPETPLFLDWRKILYRGQAAASWPLGPSLLRNPDKDLVLGGQTGTAESQVFAEWVCLDRFVKHCDSIGLSIPNDSIEFRATYFEQNDLSPFTRMGALWPHPKLFELMALARHHGLPTRLLDWSRRSYVAAYFAASGALTAKPCDHCPADVVDSSEQRFAVWALDTGLENLFKKLRVVRVPGHNNANMAAQAGVFTLLLQESAGPRLPLQGTELLDEYLNQPTCPLKKVTVPVAEAPAVIHLCEKYGVTGATVYPDYYGAARASMDAFHCWRLEQLRSAG